MGENLEQTFTKTVLVEVVSCWVQRNSVVNEIPTFQHSLVDGFKYFIFSPLFGEMI